MTDLFSAVNPACREFVAVVETLLERRRQETLDAAATPAARRGEARWRDDEWWHRTWTRTEFEDAVYSSYKPMRQGRVTRPPRREIVMEIADYFNCTLEERNRLLLAAQATPVAPYLTGTRLDKALTLAGEVVQSLPFPALIINRDWNVYSLNRHLLTLFNLTPDLVAHVLMQMPSGTLNILRLLFDPQLPLYAALTHNRASWEVMVRQTLYGFKVANSLCQFEAWYHEMVEELFTLPDFERHWRAVQIDGALPAVNPHLPHAAPVESSGHFALEVMIPHTTPPNTVARLRPLRISVGYFQFEYPQILALAPADAPTQAIFVALNIPVNEPTPAVNTVSR
jgi:hypothetical protein